jgi:hypothetical protein
METLAEIQGLCNERNGKKYFSNLGAKFNKRRAF